MRLNSKGQVTIPSELRRSHNLREGDEVDVVDVDGELRIVRTEERGRGRSLVEHMRGTASTTMTTDEIMALLRDD